MIFLRQLAHSRLFSNMISPITTLQIFHKNSTHYNMKIEKSGRTLAFKENSQASVFKNMKLLHMIKQPDKI